MSFWFVVLMLTVLQSSAHSMSMCGSRDAIVKALNSKYQETGKAIGIAGQVNLMEVFTSKTGTWTFVVTNSQGRSCIIAAGNNWQDIPPKKDDET